MNRHPSHRLKCSPVPRKGPQLQAPSVRGVVDRLPQIEQSWGGLLGLIGNLKSEYYNLSDICLRHTILSKMLSEGPIEKPVDIITLYTENVPGSIRHIG